MKSIGFLLKYEIRTFLLKIIPQNISLTIMITSCQIDKFGKVIKKRIICFGVLHKK